ncbi:hypothetical protein RQP46_011481 [Phenoliferia psychrophenolica]
MDTEKSTAATTPDASLPTSKAASLNHHELSTEPKKDRAPVFVVVLCLFQSFSGLLFGWQSGVISGMINQVDYLERFGEPDPTATSGYSIPTTRQALITSFMGLGALFGSLAGGQMKVIGTKKATLVSLLIFMIGVAIETSCQHQWGQIIAARFISGFGIGAMSMLAPAFQAECSPRHLRGMITSTFQLACTLGIFLANVVNYNSRWYKGAMQWQIPASLSMIFAVLFALGIFFSPEAPRYHLGRGEIDLAAKSLSKLRALPIDDPELLAELDDMKAQVELEAQSADATYWDCFRSEDRMRLRTLIGIMVQAGQQWTGVNFFFSYGVKFFAASGITDSFKVQVILSAVNVICTFPGLWAVENLGRRKTLFIGSTIMFIGQIVAGALGTAYPDGKVAGKILIAFSCIFIAGWVVAAEQFPLKVAPYCVAFATGSNWLNNFVLAMITPYITDAGYGNLQAKITFIWAGAIVLFTGLVFFFVPETKGLSLIQVDELYHARVVAWRSADWKPFSDDPHSALKSEAMSHHEEAPKRALE